MNIWFQFVLGKSLQGWTLVGPVATTSFKAITLPYLQLDPTRPRSRAQMDMFAFSCSCWMQCFVDRVCLQVQDAVKDVTKNIQVEKISHMGYKFD